MREQVPGVPIVPIIRGWVCKKSEKCSEDETTGIYLATLKDDIEAASSFGYGFAVFTYEVLLRETHINTFNQVLHDLK